MKKSVLETKGCFENGVFNVTHIKITKRIAEHPNNAKLGLKAGYLERTNACSPSCDTLPTPAGGYYECAGGNCVFFPYV